MNIHISVGDLADWIVEHRKGNAFKDDTWENIVAGLQDDIEHGNMLFVCNDHNNIIGVITFISDRENKVVFVRNILITKYTALAIFAQHFRENFKGYALCANRYNEEVMYDTNRLINHLIKRNH